MMNPTPAISNVKGMPVNPQNALAVIEAFENLFGNSHNGIAFAPVRFDIEAVLQMLSDNNYLASRFQFIVDRERKFNLIVRLTNNPKFSNTYSNEDQFHLIDQQRPILLQQATVVNDLLATSLSLQEIWREKIEVVADNTICVTHSTETIQALFEYAQQLKEEGSEVAYFQFELGLFQGHLPESDILQYFNDKFAHRITMIGSFVTKSGVKVFPIDIGKLNP